MDEQKGTGALEPKQEAALKRQIEHAKSSYMPSIVRHEDDGSKTDMTLVELSEIVNLRQRVSDLEHALGEDADWFARAKSAERERDQLRLDMASNHKITKDMVKRHGEETCRLLAEIEEWKTASGLERGGDPDGVTPDDLRNELGHLRTTQEKSWGAADEALCAQYETALRDLFDACDVLMGDSDLPDDDSKEMMAMRRAAAILNDSHRGHE